MTDTCATGEDGGGMKAIGGAEIVPDGRPDNDGVRSEDTESGCCKPPKYCKFKNTNATSTIPDSATASSSPDCLAWSNNLHQLCYSCSSCKAGVVAVLRRGWKKLTIANLILLIVVIIMSSLTCCALRNNRRRRHVTGAHP
ncbi:tetraspanin-12-like [Zingiber officinale]|uniref:tetraspanin-12-like n=1 Tax=Zingiber officinale TaxID=94328 RepID=UPI001C4C9CA9|nr:tetraspanin-12-like [Zingiber officinale]